MFIRLQFWKIKRSMSPRAEFKRALWKNLNAAWNSNHLPAFRWYQTHLFRFSAAALSGVLAVGFFTTGVYAYSSPDVTEGHILYPLKQGIEKLEEKLQTTPAARARFLLKKASRREAEKVVLKREHRAAQVQRVDRQIKKVEEQLEKTNEALKKTPAVDVKLEQEVQDRLEVRQKKLEQKLEQRQNNLEERDKRLEERKQELQQNLPIVPQPVNQPTGETSPPAPLL